MKKKLLYYCLLGSLLAYIVLFFIDIELQRGNINFGIISFELAGNINSSNDIINYWADNNNLNLAAFSIGFDYLFILFYVSFLIIWTSILSEGFYKQTSKNFASLIMLITVLAGIFDMIENYSLMHVLGRDQNNLWPLLAYYFASMKFVFLTIAILYNLIISIIKRFISV